MGTQGRTIEQELASIAGAQHGVVTRAQLLAAGLTQKEIAARVRRRTLLREHRGVYRVGHRAPNIEATYLAAVLTAGEGAALCGRAAAHLWGLSRGRAPPAEVVAPTERRIDGVRTHRCRGLDAREVTLFKAISVTTLPRTIVDLGAELGEEDLARLCHEAGVQYRVTPGDVLAVLARRPTSPGAGKVRRVTAGEVHVALSRLESGFLALLREHGLPLPVTNRPAGGRRVDCRWPGHRLTVELDSYSFHNSRHSWEMDRRREREARARGDDFRRYTYGDVVEDPRLMLAELRGLFLTKLPE